MPLDPTHKNFNNTLALAISIGVFMLVLSIIIIVSCCCCCAAKQKQNDATSVELSNVHDGSVHPGLPDPDPKVLICSLSQLFEYMVLTYNIRIGGSGRSFLPRWRRECITPSNTYILINSWNNLRAVSTGTPPTTSRISSCCQYVTSTSPRGTVAVLIGGKHFKM